MPGRAGGVGPPIVDAHGALEVDERLAAFLHVDREHSRIGDQHDVPHAWVPAGVKLGDLHETTVRLGRP